MAQYTVPVHKMGSSRRLALTAVLSSTSDPLQCCQLAHWQHAAIRSFVGKPSLKGPHLTWNGPLEKTHVSLWLVLPTELEMNYIHALVTTVPNNQPAKGKKTFDLTVGQNL